MHVSDFINKLLDILEQLGLSDSFRNNPAYGRRVIKEIINALYFTCNDNIYRMEQIQFDKHSVSLLINHTNTEHDLPIRESRHLYLTALDPSLLIIRTTMMANDDTTYYKMERSINEIAVVLYNNDMTFRNITTTISNRDDEENTIKKSSRGNIEIKISKFNEYGIEEYYEEKHYNDVYFGNYVNELTDEELLSLPKSLIHSENKELHSDYNLIAKRICLDIIQVIEQVPAQNIDCEYATVLDDRNLISDINIPKDALEKALNSEERFITPITMSEINQKIYKESSMKTIIGLQQLAKPRTKNYYPILIGQNGWQYNKVYHSHIVQ